jgi:regulator of ribonuclease activity A
LVYPATEHTRGKHHEFQDPDLLDNNEEQGSRWQHARRRAHVPALRWATRFSGQIVTLKVFEDNSLVREALAGSGEGKVLLIDGGGSLRCALVGDQLAILAHKNHWEGIVVYGCIRDSGTSAKSTLASVRSTRTR